MTDSNLPNHEDAGLRTHSSFDLEAANNYTWSARVRSTGEDEATAYARNSSFNICRQASFKESDPDPCAVEYLLSALGADLVIGFRSSAARRGITIYALEASVLGRLNNPLVLLGVVGEAGHPGFEAISASLYVSTDVDDQVLAPIWQETLARSPLVNTLQRCLRLSLEIKSTI